MSSLIARIMLALLMLPLAASAYCVIFVLIDDLTRLNSSRSFVAAGAGTGGLVVIYWALLWRRSVRWTGHRLVLTVAALPAAALAGALVCRAFADVEAEFGIFIGGVSAILLWLVATVFLWRETGEERLARIRAAGVGAVACPRCGYNMTGLRATTCPECGAAFTIDELVASQPGSEAASL